MRICQLAIAAITLVGLRDLAHAGDDLEASAHAGVDLGATATRAGDAGGGSTGDVAIGGSIDGSAELPYRNSSSYIRGTATAALRAGSDGPGLTLSEQARTRPYALELFQFEFAERLALDLVPRLSDRPDRWRRRYSDAGFDVDVIGVQYIGARWGAQLIRVDNGFDWERQHDGDASERRFVQTADWSPLSITRRAHGVEIGRLDLIALEARAIGGTHSGAVLTTFAPRISGLRLGPVTVDAGIGHAATGSAQLSVDNKVVSTITSDQLPTTKIPAFRLRAATTLGRFDATAGIERGMYLAMDAALVVEERATATLATELAGADVTATGFAAHSVIWTSKTDSTEHVTGGGSVAVAMGLPDRWRLVNQAELARTFYASTEGDRTPRVDTALRLDVGLHRELKNWIPR
jgi:hypothetical protein